MKLILALTKRAVHSGLLTALVGECIAHSVLILAMMVVLSAILLTARGVEWLFPHTVRALLKALHW
jgi:hypothetical protein